ncbi:MAG: type IV pilus modification protein PilV [Propionivibrio sp.]
MSIYAPPKGKTNHQQGFSLIEVLVTMIIVAIGLMGLISLMMKGLQANATSSLRTMAINQAYDMADRMRANLAGVQAGDYDSIVPPGSSSSCPIAVTSNVSPPTPTSLAACTTTNCSSASCTAAVIAARDECVWHNANAVLLPSGSGAICKDNANNWYSIHISWDDSKSGNPDKTFILRFEP